MTDIQIAQQAAPLPIGDIAAACGIDPQYLEQYGRYKAKIDYRLLRDRADRPDGKLILVTAITPTPAGEGKTTTTVGLTDGLRKIGKNAVAALREPSLGPVFGVKGGAAGGGYAQVIPMEDINLHFTGDFHAIGAANNLLAALLDNHIQQGNALGIDCKQIVWKRCVDMNDRQLRHVIDGLGGRMQGVPREDGFDITVASEVMAVLCLASDIPDLKARLGRMIVAYTFDGRPVTAHDLKAEGAMTALLELGGMSWAMTGVCAGCGVMELVLRSTLRRSYRRSWQQFRQQNGPDGTVNFDAGGIREENEKGKPTHFDWADWDVCVMTPKVIVLTFKTPVLLFFPYSREAAITVAHAARAFGKEDSLVYRKRI